MYKMGFLLFVAYIYTRFIQSKSAAPGVSVTSPFLRTRRSRCFDSDSACG